MCQNDIFLLQFGTKNIWEKPLASIWPTISANIFPNLQRRRKSPRWKATSWVSVVELCRKTIRTTTENLKILGASLATHQQLHLKKVLSTKACNNWAMNFHQNSMVLNDKSWLNHSPNFPILASAEVYLKACLTMNRLSCPIGIPIKVILAQNDWALAGWLPSQAAGMYQVSPIKMVCCVLHMRVIPSNPRKTEENHDDSQPRRKVRTGAQQQVLLPLQEVSAFILAPSMCLWCFWM